MTKLHDVSTAHVPITARPPRSICEETRGGWGCCTHRGDGYRATQDSRCALHTLTCLTLRLTTRGWGVSPHFVDEQVEHREVERVLLGHTGEELGLEPL